MVPFKTKVYFIVCHFNIYIALKNKPFFYENQNLDLQKKILQFTLNESSLFHVNTEI